MDSVIADHGGAVFYAEDFALVVGNGLLTGPCGHWIFYEMTEFSGVSLPVDGDGRMYSGITTLVKGRLGGKEKRRKATQIKRRRRGGA